MIKTEFESGTFYLGDCFDVMATLEPGSVDMVLNDPPYGTTQNKWDAVIPFEPMWTAYWRLLKSNGAAILTAAQPFTSALIASQVSLMKDCLVWDKVGTTGFQNAKRRPLRRHEDVLVFCRSSPPYYPQMEVRGAPRKKGGSKKDNGNYGDLRSSESFNNEYYPTSIIQISNAKKGGLIHPTQKPVALFEYLIRTYTNPGELVLDNTAGSGTTAIAAMNAGRRWICIERDEGYYEKAVQRIKDHEEKLKNA